MAIRAPVALATTRRMLRQDLLARKGRIAASAPSSVAADIAIRVTDIVAVFFVEGVVGDEAEGVAPEDEAVVHGEAEAFEEEGVLQAAEVFQVAVFAEVEVQVAHAEGEVRGEGVDG